MKRIYGAVFILLCMVLITFSVTFYIRGFTRSSLQILNEATSFYAKQQYGLCADKLVDLDAFYDDNKNILQFIVQKDIVSDLQKSAKGLPAYNTADSPQEFYYAANALQNDLIFLQRSFFSIL